MNIAIFEDSSADEQSILGLYQYCQSFHAYFRNYALIIYTSILIKKKLCHNQLYQNKNQLGFRSLHSVVKIQSLLSNTDDWYFNLDEGTCTGIVLVDFEKAFDKVESEVLVKKLSNYRIKNAERKGFFSYLSNRRQCSENNGGLSSQSPEKFQTFLRHPLLYS